MERRGEAQQHKTSYGGLQMKRERSGLERSLSFSHRLESGKAGAYRSGLFPTSWLRCSCRARRSTPCARRLSGHAPSSSAHARPSDRSCRARRPHRDATSRQLRDARPPWCDASEPCFPPIYWSRSRDRGPAISTTGSSPGPLALPCRQAAIVSERGGGAINRQFLGYDLHQLVGYRQRQRRRCVAGQPRVDRRAV